MFEKILELDAALLLFFNHLNNPLFDFIFYWISYKWLWVPFYGYLAWFLFKRKREHFYLLLVLVAVLITMSDQISSSIIKDSVMRLRPCHDPLIASEIHTVYGYCGGKYGFVSSHAANSFAIATFLIVLFRQRYPALSRVLIIWAATVSFSRIYLGVHYPGDIIGGALLGSILGIAMGKTFRFYMINFAAVKKRPSRITQEKPND